MKKFFLFFNKYDFSSLFGFFIGLLLSLLLVLLFNENPALVLKVLTQSFLQSKYDFGLTLFYTTCFIFSGFAFSIPFKAGLFQIGTEGALIFSAMAGAVSGVLLKSTLPGFMGDLAGFLCLILISMITGILASWMIAAIKVFKQGHEVVVAIMLNFIFTALSSYIVLTYFQNPESQNPESALILTEYQWLQHDPLKIYFDQSPVSVFFLGALLSCFVIWFFENKTRWGLELKAFGENPTAASRMGISSFKVYFIAFAWSGFFAACIGLTEVLGNTFQFKIGFSPSYGFLGIVVALLAQGHAGGMIFSALVMAILHKGASDLDLETQFLTRDFSKVLQATIIFCVAGAYYIGQKKKGSR